MFRLVLIDRLYIIKTYYYSDVLSPKFCGEGTPDWAAIPSKDSLPFPIPVKAKAVPINNKTGYPER